MWKDSLEALRATEAGVDASIANDELGRVAVLRLALAEFVSIAKHRIGLSEVQFICKKIKSNHAQGWPRGATKKGGELHCLLEAILDLRNEL